jgi:hypothetical protein
MPRNMSSVQLGKGGRGSCSSSAGDTSAALCAICEMPARAVDGAPWPWLWLGSRSSAACLLR